MLTHDGQFGLQVLVNGSPLREYPCQGEWFVEGIIGRNFTLRLSKTQLDQRVEVVISVDGLSIMDGKPAKVDGRGYVLESGKRSLDIPGWRLNEKEVASFFFSSLPEAYASQMGKPMNIGVIGAKIFSEQMPEVPLWSEAPGASSPPTATGKVFSGVPMPPSQAPSAPGVGTGFGSRQAHRVSSVHFERDQATAQTLVLRYDTAANLEARGVVLDGRGDRVMKADPFPGDSGCTPPPGWRG